MIQVGAPVQLGRLRSAAGITIISGQPGASAYQVAVANGFVGTEAEWLESLNGTGGGGGTVGGIDDVPGLSAALNAEASTRAAADTALDGRVDTLEAAGPFAPALGSDDNYVTDAEKAALHAHANKAALDNVSGVNTGDQTLPTWSTIAGKPAVVAEGATQAAARAAIGAGTSSLALGTTGSTAKAGDYAPAAADISDSTSVGRAVVKAADAAAARTALALGTAATHADSDYAPATHNHDSRYYTEAEVDALIAGVSGSSGLTAPQALAHVWIGA